MEGGCQEDDLVTFEVTETGRSGANTIQFVQ